MKTLEFAWFVYERIRINLINPRVKKKERGLHVNLLDPAPVTVACVADVNLLYRASAN